MDLTTATQFYKQWHTVDPSTLDEAKLNEMMAELKKQGKVKNTEAAGTSFRIIQRVAHQVDEKAWLDFAKTGDLPPIKLTPKEMEVVRGGCVGTAIGIFIAACGLGLAIGSRIWSK